MLPKCSLQPDILIKSAVDNACAVNNGGCSHFCLPSATSPLGYNCTCPDGFVTENETTCVCKSLATIVSDSGGISFSTNDSKCCHELP